MKERTLNRVCCVMFGGWFGCSGGKRVAMISKAKTCVSRAVRVGAEQNWCKHPCSRPGAAQGKRGRVQCYLTPSWRWSRHGAIHAAHSVRDDGCSMSANLITRPSYSAFFMYFHCPARTPVPRPVKRGFRSSQDFILASQTTSNQTSSCSPATQFRTVLPVCRDYADWTDILGSGIVSKRLA